MSFPRYPRYKDSGVEWLGEVPEHWDVLALKRILSLKSGDSITAESITDAGAYPVLGGNGLRGFTSGFTHEGHFVVVGRQGALCGNVNYANGKFWASEHAVVVSPLKHVETKWVGEMLKAMNLNQHSVSAAQPGLSMEFVGTLRTVFPEFKEQRIIATFLDIETSKIDALISEQQRLIELLQEKRQAVISHAVTKGLNSDVPMKSSGVEWLGDVPEHWKVVALKHLLARPVIDGPHESPVKLDEGVPFVSAESLSKGFVDFTKMWGYISPDDHARFSRRYKPERGDILMVKLGATTGTSAIVETDADFSVWVPLAAIRLKSEFEPRFVLHVLRSNNLRRAYELNWTYGTQQTLGLGTISNLRIPIPPKQERKDISRHLDSILPLFESLTVESERAIELLQERRTALISAAVTGKIDVRGWAAKASA